MSGGITSNKKRYPKSLGAWPEDAKTVIHERGQHQGIVFDAMLGLAQCVADGVCVFCGGKPLIRVGLGERKEVPCTLCNGTGKFGESEHHIDIDDIYTARVFELGRALGRIEGERSVSLVR